MDNLSVVKTKESIRRALYQALSKKHYEKISIIELCDLAQINRGTFYYHYYSKEHLIEELINEYAESFICSMTNELPSNEKSRITTKPIPSAYKLFECCEKYAEEIKVLFGNGFEETFTTELYKQLHAFFSKHIKVQVEIQEKNKDFFSRIKTNQLVFGIVYFIKNHSIYSYEEFAEIYTFSTETNIQEILFSRNKN